MFLVNATTGDFALKLYNTASRGSADVVWEAQLITHLIDRGAPVARPIAGSTGMVCSFHFDGAERVGMLTEWCAGDKPTPSTSTYALLGAAAASIHAATADFTPSLPREQYGAHELIDQQLERMEQHLRAADRWEQMVGLATRLRSVPADPNLDRGVCHMDLTLDNVCLSGDRLTVFDFDSAGTCWRALEPHTVLLASRTFYDAWLQGYRSIRTFSALDERAVGAFVVIGQLRVVAWDLGVARSSRGEPKIKGGAALARVVDQWLSWEKGLGGTKR